MKPPRFEYHDPDLLEDALDLLAYFGDDSKVLAGGQSLMPLLNLRLSRPDHVVDINRVEELRGIREVGGRVVIGALTRHAEVEVSATVARLAPLLNEAVPFIGHQAIRSRGTLGGSLAHADPSAELPAVMTALDATLTLASRERERRVPAAEFFVMPLTTVATSQELITSVDFAVQSPRAGSAVEELARRRGDFALVGVVVSVELDDSERVATARVVTFGTGPHPVRLAETEQVLQGRRLSEDVLEETGRSAAAEVTPAGDRHGSTAYRQSITGVLVARAVQRAHGRARNKGERNQDS